MHELESLTRWLNLQKDLFSYLQMSTITASGITLKLRKAGINPLALARFPTYFFEIFSEGSLIPSGRIELRIIPEEKQAKRFGHLAFSIAEPFRGKGLAAKAGRLLLPLAGSHDLPGVWIVCDRANPASCRTCENMGARLIDQGPVDPRLRKEDIMSGVASRYYVESSPAGSSLPELCEARLPPLNKIIPD